MALLLRRVQALGFVRLQVLKEHETIKHAALLDIVAFYERVRARLCVLMQCPSAPQLWSALLAAGWRCPVAGTCAWCRAKLVPQLEGCGCCRCRTGGGERGARGGGGGGAQDPACTTYSGALLYFKGYHAIQTHRVAHELWKGGRKVPSRLCTWGCLAHVRTAAAQSGASSCRQRQLMLWDVSRRGTAPGSAPQLEA